MSEKTIEKSKILIYYNSKMTEYYNLLLEYELSHKKPHCDYKDISNKMKEIIDQEDEIYNSLNVFEIKEIILYVKNTIKSYNERVRLVGHLENRMQAILLNNINGTALETVVNSSIDILTLRDIDGLLDATDEIDEENKNEFYKLWVNEKFAKLKNNSYIERLAIENGFDVYRINPILPKDIEIKYDEKIYARIERNIIFSLMTALDNLNKLDILYMVDHIKITGIYRTFEATIQLIGIKERLAFLRKENFNEFKTIFYLAYGNNNKEQMQHAKKLIRQKEEALNN